MKHVVWDWNGTLFDDLTIVVSAVNAAIEPLGLRSIDAERYRDLYTRPVHVFYERLLGRPLTSEEWQSIDLSFHEAYRASLNDAGLAADAPIALERVRELGGSQSVLSMWWHDELVPTAERLGVSGYMLRVDGIRADAGAEKQGHLEAHIVELVEGHGVQDTIVMIGDTLDDAIAAADVGVECVLVDSGSHHRDELAATGCPVAPSLLEALDAVGVR